MAYVYDDHVHESILRMIPTDGKVIGSIGCGSAATEARLVQMGREVHGVDVAQAVYEIAKSRLTSMRIIPPENDQPFEANSLDGLILADVIEHIPFAWNALAKFATAVRPGGWVVISVPNMRNFEAVGTYLVRGDWPENDTGIFDRTHLHFMTHKRLERWASSAGLQIEQWYARPDPRHPRRNRIIKVLNSCALGLFTRIIDYQVQGRFRKRG